MALLQMLVLIFAITYLPHKQFKVYYFATFDDVARQLTLPAWEMTVLPLATSPLAPLSQVVPTCPSLSPADRWTPPVGSIPNLQPASSSREHTSMAGAFAPVQGRGGASAARGNGRLAQDSAQVAQSVACSALQRRHVGEGKAGFEQRVA
jgi:hypothetical protein